MNEKRANIEIIAPSVEEAVAKGLAELGLPEEAVDVEVLDEGSKGLFGLGSRQTRVRLTIKTHSDAEDEAPVNEAEAFDLDEPQQITEIRDEEEDGEELVE